MADTSWNLLWPERTQWRLCTTLFPFCLPVCKAELQQHTCTSCLWILESNFQFGKGLKYCNTFGTCVCVQQWQFSRDKTDKNWSSVTWYSDAKHQSAWLLSVLYTYWCFSCCLSSYLCLQVKRRCLSMTARLQSVPSARCCSGPESYRNTWRQK